MANERKQLTYIANVTVGDTIIVSERGHWGAEGWTDLAVCPVTRKTKTEITLDLPDGTPSRWRFSTYNVSCITPRTRHSTMTTRWDRLHYGSLFLPAEGENLDAVRAKIAKQEQRVKDRDAATEMKKRREYEERQQKRLDAIAAFWAETGSALWTGRQEMDTPVGVVHILRNAPLRYRDGLKNVVFVSLREPIPNAAPDGDPYDRLYVASVSGIYQQRVFGGGMGTSTFQSTVRAESIEEMVYDICH